MAAYDNVSLPAPPNIATAGNYAQLLMSGLSSLPQQYYAGQQAQYEQRQRDLLQGGVPTDQSGNVDYNEILRRAMQAGGTSTALQAIPLMQRQQLISASLQSGQQPVQDPLYPSSQPPPNVGPKAPTAATGPAQIDPRWPCYEPSTGVQSEKADNLNSLAAESHTDLDGFLRAYPGYR